ncbi:MAG TPA: N-acetylglucosamine-6-phosphate deacetylase [Lentisphaeria bacterium]|nr:MAG: N-acetylglucosamine-6-phosphate deacetylase [Lentisphaerae bacterium GWF2_38_69]HBM16178.1 N-acetylglucosamine-6-phosphate deacetylase [Lentisphaeria bacterium]
MSVKPTSIQRILFTADYCYTPNKKIVDASILCEDEKIVAIGNTSSFNVDKNTNIFHLQGTYAVPGFIDTHIHGAGGFDSSTAEEGKEDFKLMSKTLVSHGITSFLPTIVSIPRKRMLSTISTLAELVAKEYLGAAPEGIRVEGPYINKVKRGSQNEEYIRSIDIGELKEIISAGQGKIKIMTFAPELDNSIKLVEILKENGIIPSMGHSMADENAVINAIDAGAHHCTHLYNGMPVLHHRSVGIAGVSLTDDRVTTEIILDGFHIHPRMIDIVCRTKPKDKIIGISDAIQGAGLSDGVYHLGSTQINVKDGKALTDEGIIAGTTLTLEQGWNHLVKYSQLDITDAAACLTINPAKLLSLNQQGELLPGRNADISFFSKEINKAVMTVRKGKIVYIDKAYTFNSHISNPGVLSRNHT